MFEGTLLDSSTARRPVLAASDWLVAIAVGLLGFFIGSMKLPVIASPDGTRALLVRAAVFGGALAFYSISVSYTFKDARRQGLNAWLWAAVVLLASLPGFLIYLFYSAAKTSDWKRVTMPIAYTVQAMLVCAAALVPLINIQALPNTWAITKAYLPMGQAHMGDTAHSPRPKIYKPSPLETVLVEPLQTPVRESAQGRVEAPQIGNGIEGLENGLGGPGTGPLLGFTPTTPGPPPDIPRSKPAETRRIKISVGVEAARLINGPQPEYPRLALMTHVQGVVRIHAIIGADGTVQELKVMSGHPLLIPAATEAVAQWRYKPTLLNGEPVEVDTEIDVNFVLNN